MRGLCASMAVCFLLSASVAHADCSMPRASLSPAQSTVLPSKASLYLFVPGFDLQEPNADPTSVVSIRSEAGGAIAFASELVSVNAIGGVYRLSLPALPDGAVIVKHGDEETRHEISSKISAPAAAPRVLSDGETTTMWTCSFQSTRDLKLTPDGALAYRVSWSTQVKGSRQCVSAVFPSGAGAHHGGAKGDPQLTLGHLDCVGFNFFWPGGVAAEIRVTALYSDGAERHVGDLRVKAPSDGRSEGDYHIGMMEKVSATLPEVKVVDGCP